MYIYTYIYEQISCCLTEQRVNIVSTAMSYRHRPSQNRDLWQCLRVSNEIFTNHNRRHIHSLVFSLRGRMGRNQSPVV